MLFPVAFCVFVVALLIAGAKGKTAVGGGLVIALLFFTPARIITVWLIGAPFRELAYQREQAAHQAELAANSKLPCWQPDPQHPFSTYVPPKPGQKVCPGAQWRHD